MSGLRHLLFLIVVNSILFVAFSFQRRQLKCMTTLASVARRDGAHIVECKESEYNTLLEEKVETLKSLLGSHCNGKDVEVFESPKSNYRMRANFNVWRDKPRDDSPEGMYYAMFEKEANNHKTAFEVKEFPRGSILINQLMVRLKDGVIPSSEVLRNGLFEARFVTTLSGESVIVLCYKKPLPETWLEAAEAASKQLNTKIVGRSRKVKLIAGGGEIVEEVLTVKGKPLKYYQTEGAFSQPNAIVCQKMLEWSLSVTDGSKEKDEDVLELYCGGGTFTAAIAQNFRQVLATEISKTSVELALDCFKANNIDNIKIARLSSEEFTEAYTGKRIFQRLTESGIKFSDYKFSTVLVDPPRAGIDAATCALLCRFDKIVYISCNPNTLARDIQVMSGTHEVVRLAAFDQFPYTHHLEAGVLLVKKTEGAALPPSIPDTGALTELAGKKRKAGGDDGDGGADNDGNVDGAEDDATGNEA